MQITAEERQTMESEIFALVLGATRQRVPFDPLTMISPRALAEAEGVSADAVRMRLELWRQDRFDVRRVAIHDATAQWATLTITGPRSRHLVEGPHGRRVRPEAEAVGVRLGVERVLGVWPGAPPYYNPRRARRAAQRGDST